MALSISEKGLAIIKEFEGCVLKAYKCPAGVWTIGYGHTSGVKSGMKITAAQAEEYLKSDCKWAENAVNAWANKYGWNQNQFDALVSFTFNCGAGNLDTLLAGGKRTIVEISEKILLYNKANGETLAGLVRRRKAEKALFDAECTESASKTAKAQNTTVLAWQKAAVKDGFSFPKYGTDGAWGSECESVAKKAIVKKRSSYLYKNMTKIVQKAVGVTVDGLCGSDTAAAIKKYQKANGLTADGCVGLNTWNKILGVE